MSVLFLGVILGLSGCLFSIGLFKLYGVWANKRAMDRFIKQEIANQVVKQVIRKDEIQETIQQLEDLANEED